MTQPLGEAPTRVEDDEGRPRFGTYRGEFGEVSLERLRPPYGLAAPMRWLKRKRWVYVQVSSPDIIAGFAISDLAYTSNAFVTVVDRATHAVDAL